MGLTRHRTLARPTLHKSVDARRLSVTAALTYPVTDRAGDFVVPEGIDWTVHRARPWVGYEHLRWNKARSAWVHPDHPTAADDPVVIGTALDPRTNRHAVELKSVVIDGRDVPVPFGTTFFDPADQLQSQMFALVEDDTLPAVSIEFALRKGRYRELGPSPLENRPAFHVESCTGLGWVHCAEPVNPGALTLRKGLSPAWERVVRVAESGRVRGEAAHPFLLKSFRDRLPPVKASTVTGGFSPQRKAMPADADLEPAYQIDDPDQADTAPAAKNGVEAFYDHAQQLLDLIASLEADMEASDSPELIDAAGKVMPKIEALAEQLKGHADKHDAKLQAKRGGKEEPAEDDDAEPDMEVDEDGVLKAMRKPFYKAIKSARVKRFSKAEVAAAAVVSTDTPEELAAAQAELAAADRLLAKRKRAFS